MYISKDDIAHYFEAQERLALSGCPSSNAERDPLSLGIHRETWPDQPVLSLGDLLEEIQESRDNLSLPHIESVLLAFALGKAQKRNVIWRWAVCQLMFESNPSLMG